MKIYSSYMLKALFERKWTIMECVRILTPHAHKFKAIAFRGMSGALIAPSVADQMDKQIILVRKTEIDDHRSHSFEPVEGTVGVDYFIIDDLTMSGRTIREIQQQIFTAESEHINCTVHGKCVGIYLFHERTLFLRGGSNTWKGLFLEN